MRNRSSFAEPRCAGRDVVKDRTPVSPRTRGVLTLLLVAVASPVSAQWTADLRVEETAGIRRTAYPVSVRLEVPEGRLAFVSQVRLVDGEHEVAVQGTAWSEWPDGSIRDLEIDFNVSIDPLAERSLELRYGADVTAGEPPGRALVLVEDEGSIEAGSIRLNKGGYTLLSSVAYREELIGRGRNGLTIVERSGIRRDPREIDWESVDTPKAGPLTVLARYRGTLALSGGSNAHITLDMELPNSKSWLKMSVSVSDPDGKVGDLGFETPLQLGNYPWTWDVSTPSHTYGAFRDPTGSVLFRSTLEPEGGSSWEVRAGSAGSERRLELSGDAGAVPAPLWAHLVGADEAVAFAVEERTGTPGTVTMWLTGTGQTTITFRSAEPTTEHAFTVYQHYVTTPVPIGAATSPASILSPLRVTVD